MSDYLLYNLSVTMIGNLTLPGAFLFHLFIFLETDANTCTLLFTLLGKMCYKAPGLGPFR